MKALTSCMGLFSLVHLHSVLFTEECQFIWASSDCFFFKLETVITDFLLEFFKLDFYYNILECKSGVSLHWPPELVLVI